MTTKAVFTVSGTSTRMTRVSLTVESVGESSVTGTVLGVPGAHTIAREDVTRVFSRETGVTDYATMLELLSN